ncbi:APC family permease [Microbacterium sp. STN6]|uniref:APC family permease n=1 Tax=Microbacterium sp. STN6 TaxID=2995588 RepID=UPI002260C713|nr:APC family permease [Microbacterium sp. STN6]MCX7520838.1 APC family permease [Microbacterium sp. STN6]
MTRTLNEPRDPKTGHEEFKLKRHVGMIGLLFTAIGSIIGSGWLFGAFHASQIAGPAAIFSWLIAAVMIILIGLCYAELGPMFPISGGVVRYPHLVWGSFGSYSLGFITWIASAAVPAIEVVGALTYATKFAPFTVKATDNGATAQVLTPLGIVVAIALLAVFVVINYYGVRLFAQVNNVLVWWKLFVIALVIVVFLITAFATTRMGSPENFTSAGFAPSGFSAVFVCISTAGITFSYLGFRQGIELAGETKNPSRNIPIALIGSVAICAILYALLQLAFTLAVPAHVLTSSHGWAGLAFNNDFGPLAALASLAGLAWLAYILYFDAIISPTDTGLIYTTIASRVSYAMGRNGNAPRWLSTNNKFGVPYWSLLVTFLVGIVLLLPFPSWQSLVGFITSATVVSFGSGPLVVAVLRRKLPNRERPFRLPGGDIIPFLAFYSANMIVFWAGWATNMKLLITILIGYVLLIVFEIAGRKNGRKPTLNIKVGAAWVIPWFVLFGLVSWLFDPAAHPAMFFWVFLINLVISAVIYWIAVKVTLSTDTINEYIEDAAEESADEEKLAGGHIG